MRPCARFTILQHDSNCLMKSVQSGMVFDQNIPFNSNRGSLVCDNIDVVTKQSACYILYT